MMGFAEMRSPAAENGRAKSHNDGERTDNSNAGDVEQDVVLAVQSRRLAQLYALTRETAVTVALLIFGTGPR